MCTHPQPLRSSLASRNSFNTPFMRRLDRGREVRTIIDDSKFKNFVKSFIKFYEIQVKIVKPI